MFGLGKLLGGGVFGKLFDSIGLGWMGNVLSLALNVASGNWLAAARDVLNLVAQFSNNEWMDRIASFQPLGGFDNGGCFGNDSLSGFRLGEFQARARGFGDLVPDSVNDLFSLAKMTVDDNAHVNSLVVGAYMSAPA